MPGLSGVNATQCIRGFDAPLQRVPIFTRTGSSMAGEREECLAAGMNAYLSKPIVAETLLTTLARWMPPAD